MKELVPAATTFIYFSRTSTGTNVLADYGSQINQFFLQFFFVIIF